MKEPGIQGWERWALGALFGAAFLLRTWALGVRPAAPWEAVQAWAAWRGGEMPPGGSPFLAGWNALIFALFGPDEGGMRSGPALAGALGVLAVWALVRPFGPVAALGAAALWAISPHGVAAARFLDGGAVAAVALASALALTQGAHPARWIGVALALGVGAAAGPAFWTGVVIGVPFFLWAKTGAPGPWGRIFGLAGVAAAFAAMGGGLRASGVREMVDGLTAWLYGFTPQGLPGWWRGWESFLRLEGLILLLGLVGGIAAGRAAGPGRALGIGAALGILLRLVRFGAPFPEDTVILLPWVALAGIGVQWGWERLEPFVRAHREAAGLAFGIGGLALGAFALAPRSPAQGELWIVLGFLLGLLGVGIWWAADRGEEPGEALRGARIWERVWPVGAAGLGGTLGAMLAALAIGSFAAATALARSDGPPLGFPGPEMASPAVRAVVAFLREQAERRTGGLGGLEVVVIGEEDPVKAAFWRWTLRGFEVRLARTPPDPSVGDVWITPEGWALPLEPERWVGRSFPAFVDLRDAGGPTEQRWALWVRWSE